MGNAGAKGLCLAPLAIATVALAACGGSTPTASAPQSTALASLRQPARRIAHPRVTTGRRTQRPLRGTGGAEANDDDPGKADSGGSGAGNDNPCGLVSRADAQAILATPIHAPSEAPLGPTCIYEAFDSNSTVTLTIQGTSFAAIRHHIGDLHSIEIAGHRAYCGDYGQPTTFLPLSDGRVLNVTGPCAVGRRFAARALRQLKA